MSKKANFGEFFGNLKLEVKKCYQTGQFQLVKNKWKKTKINATFFVIFKHCAERVCMSQQVLKRNLA